MAISHTVTLGYTIPGHSVPANKTVYTSDNEINIDATVTANSTKQINTEIDKSQIQSMVLYSDVDVTVHAGDGTSIGDGATITLEAGKARIWTINSEDDCPYTIDVEKLYIVNGEDDDAKIKFYHLLTATA